VSQPTPDVQSAPGYTTAEVDALSNRAEALLDELRSVWREIRTAVAEIVGEEQTDGQDQAGDDGTDGPVPGQRGGGGGQDAELP